MSFGASLTSTHCKHNRNWRTYFYDAEKQSRKQKTNQDAGFRACTPCRLNTQALANRCAQVLCLISSFSFFLDVGDWRLPKTKHLLNIHGKISPLIQNWMDPIQETNQSVQTLIQSCTSSTSAFTKYTDLTPEFNNHTQRISCIDLAGGHDDSHSRRPLPLSTHLKSHSSSHQMLSSFSASVPFQRKLVATPPIIARWLEDQSCRRSRSTVRVSLMVCCGCCVLFVMLAGSSPSSLCCAVYLAAAIHVCCKYRCSCTCTLC